MSRSDRLEAIGAMAPHRGSTRTYSSPPARCNVEILALPFVTAFDDIGILRLSSAHEGIARFALNSCGLRATVGALFELCLNRDLFARILRASLDQAQRELFEEALSDRFVALGWLEGSAERVVQIRPRLRNGHSLACFGFSAGVLASLSAARVTTWGALQKVLDGRSRIQLERSVHQAVAARVELFKKHAGRTPAYPQG